MERDYAQVYGRACVFECIIHAANISPPPHRMSWWRNETSAKLRTFACNTLPYTCTCTHTYPPLDDIETASRYNRTNAYVCVYYVYPGGMRMYTRYRAGDNLIIPSTSPFLSSWTRE